MATFKNDFGYDVYRWDDSVQVMIPAGGALEVPDGEADAFAEQPGWKRVAKTSPPAKKAAAAKKAAPKVEKPAGQVHAEAKAAEVTDPPQEEAK